MANLNPMVYVKLDCEKCTQKFAFDVLPVNNQMPMTVKCPDCKTDATPAANLYLAQNAMGVAPTPPAPKVIEVASNLRTKIVRQKSRAYLPLSKSFATGKPACKVTGEPRTR